MLPDAELEALAADIAQNGLRQPITLFEGRILDGRNRQRACELAGVGPTFIEYDGTDPLGFVLSMNLVRRHLNESQRAMVASRIAALPVGANQHAPIGAPSQPDAAARLNVSRRAVQRARKVQEKGTAALIAAVDSGELAVSVAAQVASLPDAEQVVIVAAMDKATGKAKAATRAMKELAEQAPVAKRLPDEIGERSGPNWRIIEGDFRVVDVGTVDMIVTDPPYPKADLELWGDLARFAAARLSDRGVLFAYTGQMYLPEIMAMLGAHLNYGWTFALTLNDGANARIMGRHIIQGWKPVLAYTKGTWPSGQWADDVLHSPSRDKGLYEWQQHAAPAQRLIERYSHPNALICDPFAGVGSFGVAALQAGRQFVGIEIDPARAGTASERLVSCQ